MGYNKQDYVRIKKEFSQKYKVAEAAARERALSLYAAVPEAREIDRLLSRTALEIMGAITSGENVEEKVAELRRRNGELQEARSALLQMHGYPEDYTDVRYECAACGDTGFVGTKMCDCMRRALVNAGYESSGLGALIATQSFDNFSLDFYRDGGANFAAMQRAYQTLRHFAEHFERGTYRNFLLVGGTGLGKTHLSTAVAKTVIEQGHDVLYVTAVGMISDFEAKRFSDGEGMVHDLSRYYDAELLIVDDLGTEVTNQFTVSCLYDLINQRINRHRCTFINTNLGFEELEKRYSERITSRLLGEYDPLLFRGIDVRRQKVQKGLR